MFKTLGTDLDKGYQPLVKSSTGADMRALGQVIYTFKINNTPFTQSFIVCKHMMQHMILGTDFTATNFVGIIWTDEGTRQMVKANSSTVIELPDSMAGVPLILAHSIKIQPGCHLKVPLECTQPVTDRMDIRIDSGFHHRNPNVYIPPSYVNNPNNEYTPKYMPLTIFNLSKVDHLYIELEFDTYNVEIASEEQIKEHLAQPRNWVSQRHETLLEIPSDTAFICSPADVPGHRKIHLQDKNISGDIRQRVEELCDEYGQAFSKHNKDISRTKLVNMNVDTGDSPLVS